MKQDVVNKTIEDLVTRSRLGDQVASATLVVIGNEARKGKAQAVKVRDQVLAHIRKNPQLTQETTKFGIEVPDKEEVVGDACLLKRNLHRGTFSGAGLAILLLSLGEYSIGVLSHGPSLLKCGNKTNPIVSSIRGALSQSEHIAAFDIGNCHGEEPDVINKISTKMSDQEKKALQLGMIIGRARRIQAIADYCAPLSILCPMMAWELGE